MPRGERGPNRGEISRRSVPKRSIGAWPSFALCALTEHATNPCPSVPLRLKDSDVTWLYGPLHEHVEAVPPPKAATVSDRFGLDDGAKMGSLRSPTQEKVIRFDRNGASYVVGQEKKGGLNGEQNATPASIAAGALGVSLPASATDAQGALVSSPGAMEGTASLGSSRNTSPSEASGPRRSTMPALGSSSVTGAGGNGAPAYGVHYVNQSGKKSILKHRTISDILSHPGRMASPSSGDMMALYPSAAAQAQHQQQQGSSLNPAVGAEVEVAVKARQAHDDAMVAGNLRHPHQDVLAGSGDGTSPTVSPVARDANLHGSRSDSNLAGMAKPGAHLRGSPPPTVASPSDGALPSTITGSTARNPALANFSSRFLNRGESGDSTGTTGAGNSLDPKEKRHISFNQRVEQCIAVDHENYRDEPPPGHPSQQQHHQQQYGGGGYDGGYDATGAYQGGAQFDYDDEDEEEDEEVEEEEDEDDDPHGNQTVGASSGRRKGSGGSDESSDEEDLLTMKSSPRTSSSESSGPLTNASSYGSLRGVGGFAADGHDGFDSRSTTSSASAATGLSSPAYSIIAKLAPTRLKTSEAFPSPSPAVVDPTGFTTGTHTDWIQGGGTVATYPDPGTYGPVHQPGSGASSAAASPSHGGSAAQQSSSSNRHASTAPSGVSGTGLLHSTSGNSSSHWGDADEDLQSGGDFDYFSATDLGDDYQPAPGKTISTGSSADGAAGFGGARGSQQQAGSSAFSPSGSSATHSDHGDTSAVSSSPENNLSGTSPSTSAKAIRRRPAQSAGDEDPLGNGSAADSPPEKGVRFGDDADHDGLLYGTGPTSAAGRNGSYDEQDARGRPSQRLGSSASYERIQDAARQPRSRSGSNNGGGSLSPTGSFDAGAGGNATRYAAAASAAAGSKLGTSPQTTKSGKPRRMVPPVAGSGDGAAITRHGGFDSDSDGDGGGGRGSFDMASPHFPASPTLGHGSDSDGAMSGQWSDQPNAAAAKSKRAQAARAKSRQQYVGQSLEASASELSVDTANVPSNNPAGSPQEVGPTPLNTPTFALARVRASGSGDPHSPSVPRKPNSTGALVAPRRDDGVRIPLAEDYVDEDEGGLIGRAVEIVNTARDLIGALLGTGDRGRSWRE